MRALILISAISALCACGPAAPDPLTKVRMERDAIHADRHRRLAECQAQAIELSSAPGNVRQTALNTCIETHKKMLEIENVSLEALDKRITDLSR